MMKHKYHIYQLDDEQHFNKVYVGWDFLIKHRDGFNIKEYNKIYDGEVESDDRDEMILEKLFEKFNINHPQDYKGRSLSVSDVVVLDGTMYYCDNYGWKRI